MEHNVRASHVDYIKRSALICMSRTHIEYRKDDANWIPRSPSDCCDPVQRLQFHASSGSQAQAQILLQDTPLPGCNGMMHPVKAIILDLVPLQQVGEYSVHTLIIISNLWDTIYQRLNLFINTLLLI